MINLIDNFLNNITMYRLTLYYLLALAVASVIFSFLGVLAFNPINLAVSFIFLTAVCWAVNEVFSLTFGAVSNIESLYISALILGLIINPAVNLDQFLFLGWAAVLAMSSKYILAKFNKHIFNPAALAVFLTSVFIGHSASWWVGNTTMVPLVLIGGLLVIRKVRKFGMVGTFLAVALLTILALSFTKGSTDLLTVLEKALLHSPVLFFGFVMLTEPLTTPPLTKLQVIYAILMGFLFSPQVHFGPLYTTPEISLLIGNIFSYIVSPKQKLILHLVKKTKLADDIYEFSFATNHKIDYQPGQYMEWTLGYPEFPDSRGNRRYFTLASSPTEQDLKISVKFSQNSSKFKKYLHSLTQEQKITAGQLAGNFTLPKNPSEKSIFIAGGVGITPFRSMVKYLLDTDQKRQLVLFYSAKRPEEIIYQDVFNQAEKKLDIKIIYTVTDQDANWAGRKGYLSAEVISAEVPDFKEYTFYLSGPLAMVNSFKKTLAQMGISPSKIKTDFFPGFA